MDNIFLWLVETKRKQLTKPINVDVVSRCTNDSFVTKEIISVDMMLSRKKERKNERTNERTNKNINMLSLIMVLQNVYHYR